MTSAGAAPNEIMSASESYCSPKVLWLLVSRATRPSRLSRNMARKMAMAAHWNSPFMAMTMA